MNLEEQLVLQYKKAMEDEEIKNLIKELICFLKEKKSQKLNITTGTIEDLIINSILELGYLEKDNEQTNNIKDKFSDAGDGNITKYSEYMDKKNFYILKTQGKSWCDVFVDYLFCKTFGEEESRRLLCQSEKRKRGSSVKMSLMYLINYNIKKYKQLISKFLKKPGEKNFMHSAKIGYQIFFKNEKYEINHTGLVCGVDQDYIYTVEGNTSPQSGKINPNSVGVFLKRYDRQDERIIACLPPSFSSDQNITIETANEITRIISKIYNTIYEKYIKMVEEQDAIVQNNLDMDVYGKEKLLDSVKVLAESAIIPYFKVIYEDFIDSKKKG